MKQKKTSEKDKEAILEKLLKLFKDDNGEPIQLTETQKEIIKSIVFQDSNRVAVICPTQYGKSTATALGIILRVFIFEEGFTIIGGTESKSKIIGRYVIKHLFDDEIFITQLQITGGMLEKLKRERTKEYLTFRNGGFIRTMSAEYRNKKRLGDILLGEGSKNICIDDSVLCDDELYAYIKRMLGGQKENFLIELSNPLRKNHFYETMQDKDTKKIWIDYQTALQEGRFTEQFINEMRKEKFFDIFYECKFPASDTIDEKGYMRLLTDEEIEKAFGNVDIDLKQENYLGVDVGRGGNNTVLCVSNAKQSKIINVNNNPDLMVITGLIIDAMRNYNIKAYNVVIDDTGVGAGVTDRLKEQGYNVNAMKWGSKSNDETFTNLKAENYWKMRDWVKAGGVIDSNNNLKEQLKIAKYKVDSAGKIQMQSKNELLIQGFESPDEMDAFVLSLWPAKAKQNIEVIKKRVEGIKTTGTVESAELGAYL